MARVKANRSQILGSGGASRDRVSLPSHPATRGPTTRQRSRASRQQQSQVQTSTATPSQRGRPCTRLLASSSGQVPQLDRIRKRVRTPHPPVPGLSRKRRFSRSPDITDDEKDSGGDARVTEDEPLWSLLMATELCNQQPTPLLDLRNCTSKRIKKYRMVPLDDWFPFTRDPHAGPTFWTTIQKSFYHSCESMNVKMFQHRTLDSDALRRATGAHVNILNYINRYPGLLALLTERNIYVEEWVRVFYATAWIDRQRETIHFMLEGRRYRLNRQMVADYLGLQLHNNSLHAIVYGEDAEPPRRALVGGNFPEDYQVAILFGNNVATAHRAPDMLTPEAKVLHLALRRTLLPRSGNADSITSLQQWLLLSIMRGTEFDIVDFIFCEIEDVIFDGMSVARQQPYAHFISYMLSQVNGGQHKRKYLSSGTAFPPYAPAPRDDRRRRGQRTMMHTMEVIPPDEREAVAQENLAMPVVDAQRTYIDLDLDSASDDDDEDYLPPAVANNTKEPKVEPASNEQKTEVQKMKELMLKRMEKSDQRFMAVMEQMASMRQYTEKQANSVTNTLNMMNHSINVIYQNMMLAAPTPQPIQQALTGAGGSVTPILSLMTSSDPAAAAPFSLPANRMPSDDGALTETGVNDPKHPAQPREDGPVLTLGLTSFGAEPPGPKDNSRVDTSHVPQQVADDELMTGQDNADLTSSSPKVPRAKPDGGIIGTTTVIAVTSPTDHVAISSRPDDVNTADQVPPAMPAHNSSTDLDAHSSSAMEVTDLETQDTGTKIKVPPNTNAAKPPPAADAKEVLDACVYSSADSTSDSWYSNVVWHDQGTESRTNPELDEEASKRRALELLAEDKAEEERQLKHDAWVAYQFAVEEEILLRRQQEQQQSVLVSAAGKDEVRASKPSCRQLTLFDVFESASNLELRRTCGRLGVPGSSVPPPASRHPASSSGLELRRTSGRSGVPGSSVPPPAVSHPARGGNGQTGLQGSKRRGKGFAYWFGS